MKDVKKAVGSLSRQKLALLAEKLKEKAVQSPQPKIERRQNRFAPCRLSFAQQRLWFIEQMDPGNAAYNIPGGVKLEGKLDLEVLERVINEIVRRHEALRTRFEVRDGEPMQVIDEWTPQKLVIEDLTRLPREEREAEARRIARREAETGFDLLRGPLLRVKVLKLEEESHVALYTMHHIVSDGWSMGVLTREVLTLYQAFSQGAPSPLPELELQYADYAVWQREWLQGAELERQIEYWRTRLTGAPVLNLPTDRPRPAAQSFQGAIRDATLSAEVVQGLKELGRQENATLYMTLLAAFQALLGRYSGQDKIVVGSPIANRNRAEIENLIGFFVNTLVLCTDISGDPSFRELTRRTRDVALGAYTHQDVPFEKLVEELHPQRDLSRHPICQVFFNMDNNPGSAIKLPGLGLGSFYTDNVLSKFDLTLYVTEQPDGARLALVYNTDIFDSARITEILEQYKSLLAQIVSEPDKSINSYSLVSGRAGSLLPDPSASLSAPQYEPITETFLSVAKRNPERYAISSGNRAWTYGELSERSIRMARALVGEGVRRGDIVGIVGPPSFGLVTSMLSTLLSGGTLLTIDPNLPLLRRRLMLREAGVKHLLYVDEPGKEADVIQELELSLFAHVDAENGDIPDKRPRENTELPYLSGNDPAYLFFTSGTTGVPKGVLGRHKGLSHFLAWQRETFAVGVTDRCAQLTGLSFDVVLRDIFLPLTSGATLCLPEGAGDRDQILDWLSRENITVAHVVPSLAQSWLMSQAPQSPVESLRWAFFAGEPLSDVLVHHWRRAFPRAGVVNLYGPTETTLAKCFYLVPPNPPPGIQPVGRPLPDTQALVLRKNGILCGIGELGEIVIRTPFRTLGYLNARPEGRKTFVRNQFGTEEDDLLYHTGDLGRYCLDGSLEILGRLDHQVKIRGVRVELDEVTAVLSRHPNVKACVVVNYSEADAQNTLVAYVVLVTKHEGAVSELRSHVGRYLPSAMTPSHFEVLETLPLTANGKIDRQALPAPRRGRADHGSGHSAPQTPIEEIVVGIYKEVLKLDRVGRDDNFFELGGHSLLATQALSRVRGAFGVEIGVRDIFETAVARQLARKIEEALSGGGTDKRPPLVKASREGGERLALSFAQQRLWFLDQFAPNNPFYNLPRVVRLEGRLDLKALEWVINEVVRRHETLRTRIEEENGEPRQVIDAWEHRDLVIEDLTSLPPEQREEHARRLAREEAEMGFDLKRGPLLRVKVLKLEEEDHVILYTMHHIVSDGWSTGILIREVGALYQAYRAGAPSPLPELPIQYADFAAWQRAWLQGETLEQELEYWRERLTGMEDLGLPTDYPRPAAPSYRGAGRRFVIERELADRLRELSQRERVTLFMTLLGVFDVLMSRYCGQEDVTVGTDIANRNRAEIEGLIGFFVNQLVLRVEVRAEENFGELLKQVREVCLGAYGRQDVPFEKLVEELQPERDLARSPLFQVKLIMQNAPREDLELEDLQLRGVGGEMRTARFDLTVGVTDGGRDLSGMVEYSLDLFEEGTIERLINHYLNALKGILDLGAKPISELSFLTEEERTQIVVEWNRTETPYPRDQRIHELFELQVARMPEAIALSHGDQQITYAELNAKANRLARYLNRLGVRPESLVGVCIGRGIEMVAGLLGVIKAGGAYAPLDPAYPAERMAFVLEDAGVKALLTHRSFPVEPPASGARVIFLDQERRAIEAESPENLPISAMAENLAYVMYTSGSTGRPKGVLVPHRQVVNFFAAMDSLVGPAHEAVWLAVTSVCFDISVLELLWTLTRGYKVVIQEEQRIIQPLSRGEGISAEEGIALELEKRAAVEEDLSTPAQIRKRQVTHLQCTPSMAKMLTADGDSAETFNTLRKLMIGGEAFPTGLAERLRRIVRAEICNMYGPTETTIWSATHTLDGTESVIPIGRPIANTQIYILDCAREIAPVGVVGEVYIGGEGVARGYLNQAGLTADRFLPDPFSRVGGGRLYRTGDLARLLADGKIEFMGRSDHQVKIRGFRIELGEIETRLSSHPAVRQCVVVARQDDASERSLVAYLVGDGEIAPSVSELRGYLKERLPEYMTPAWFVWLERMPLTPNGKIDRRALPAPGAYGGDDDARDATPRTAVEEIVAGIFGEALRRDRVRRGDNFFEIGGHSLLATQVASRVRKTLGLEIAVRSVFEEPTVERFARRIEAAMRGGERDQAPPLVRVERKGAGCERFPLSFAQRRLWFIDQLDPGGAAYNIPSVVRLKGNLNLEILERVINEIVRRHEALRTRFEVESGEPAQVIDEWKRRALEVEDLTGFPPKEREERIERRIKEDADSGFDLTQGPLLRVKILKLAEDEFVALFTMHHIVSDGWSMEILKREIGVLYQAYSMDGAGDISPLPELPIQYADFAVWQRSWLQGEALEREIEYWRKQLAGMEVLELPTDRQRPRAPSYRGVSRLYRIERELAEKLRALCRREGVTLFMALLGGFDILMSRYSGQRDVAIGTDIAGRNRAEVEGLIGFFVNQLALRVEIRPRESFGELLKRVKEVCLEAYGRQDTPFEKLVEELSPERDLSRSPLFQVKLILQNAPREALQLGGVTLTGGGGDEGRSMSQERPARFDLTVSITDREDDLVGTVNYSRDLFEESTIERLMNHYTNVLRGVVEESAKPICWLNVLSAEEREQILVEWNETGRPYPRDLRIHGMFAAQAERNPDRIALMGGERQLSYGELDRRANQLGNYLRRLGVGPEVVVGLCLERSIEMVTAVMGTLKAGGAYLPLDPEHPLERLSYMLEDAGSVIALTSRKSAERLPSFWGRTILLEEEWERISEESEQEPEGEAEAENLAYVIYTSGSTGKPKGVMISHGGLANYLRWATESYRITEGEGAPVQSPIGFDLTVTSLYGPLVSGGRAHLLPEEEGIEALGTALGRESGYSLVKLTPAHLEILAQQMRDSSVEGRTGVMVIGGEELRADGLRYWRESARGTRLINEYGPTETVVGCCVYEVGGEESGRESTPIGRPIANTQVYVLDQEHEPAPVGAKGEIYIAGAGLARGYVRSPELTGEKFLPNRFGAKAGERLYRTGDIGRYLSDGNLEFSGRADGQVKIRGFRIELGEIEAALNEHKAVRQSAVVVSEDERGEKRLIGYVVVGAAASPAELKSWIRGRLPEYMTPETILPLEEIPLTANGKIDRKRLPSVKEASGEREQRYVAARTMVEEVVVGIYEELLKLDRVGIYENFFEIGGHSLLAVQLISRVRDALGIEIGVKSVFDAPTAEGLARTIEEAIRAGEKVEAPPLVRAARESHRGARAPLSFAQQRLWFIDQLDPGSTVYNLSGAVRFRSGLNLETLERVINEVVRRHEALRTRFEVIEGEPAQVIDEWEPRKLDVTDVTGLTPEEREAEVGRIAGEEARTKFDLRRGPLLRVRVLKLEEEEHVVFYTMHHIVSDGWSMGILLKEVAALYRAYNAGEPSPLKELEIQYADYAIWQRAFLAGEVLEREVEYWKERLKGAAILDLPADHPRPVTPSYRGGGERLEIGQELTSELRRLSQRETATLFMTLMAAFKTLLMRYSGEHDISVGTAIANRTRKEVEGLIGFFVNTLVLRTDLSGKPSFRELLKRERETALGAYARQEAPFEKLVEEINPERDLSRSPLFQVMMTLQNAERESPDLKAAQPSGFSREIEMAGDIWTARFDLTMSITDLGHTLRGTVNYSRDLFEKGTIERLINHYATLLREIVRDSERPISELSLLSDRERAQILVEWNQTKAPYPQDHCIHELFERQVERTPDAVAVVVEEGCFSYGELNRRANRLGHYLRGQGVGPEAVVGLCLDRSMETVVSVMGALKAGGAYLPLDPDYPPERLSYLLEDAGVKVTLTKKALKKRLPWRSGRTICLDQEHERIDKQSEKNPESAVRAENLAYVIYTSGSTGRPKGVMVGHRGLCNLAWAQKDAFRLDDRSRVLQFASLNFDASVWEIFSVLIAGGSLHMYGRESLMPGDDLLGALRARQITNLTLPPTVLATLGTEKLSDLETLVVAGEACGSEIVERWAGGRSFFNAYGPTETTVCATMGKCEAGSNRRPTIGRPIANIQAYLLDHEMEPAPVGVRGELYVSGAGVTRGYLGRPDLTAEKFIPNCFSSLGGERLYRTGDIGRYVSNGEIEFLGRVDEQVKVRGYRIEPGEIESQLARHPAIKETVALLREDGPGDKRLVAYYTRNATQGPESAVDAETLRGYLSTVLPEYMMPAAFVALDALPLTPNGKLDRKALPPPGVTSASEYEAPIGETEILLSQIWAHLLKVDRVGRHDNFFALGGHSLLTVALIERMRREGLYSNVRALFANPTLAAFAAMVGRESGAVEAPPNLIPPGCQAITPEMLTLARLSAAEIERIVSQTPGGAANVQDIYPLTPLQEGILFHYLLETEGDPYLGQGLYSFDTRDRLEEFLQALQAVIDRHDILRTAVQWEGLSEPAQVVWRRASLIREEVSIDPAAGDVAEQLRSRFDPRRHRIDIRQAPMMRAYIAHDANENRWLMFFLFQHLAVDHVTLEIMLEEIQAHLLGRAEELPAPLPFRNFVAQTRRGISRAEHEEFFREMLGDVEEPTAPFGLLGAHEGGSGITEARSGLGPTLSLRLRARARALGVSAASLCHLAWAQVLARASGRDDVVFGTVLLGRMQGNEGADRALGFFINTLPVRIRVGDEGVARSVKKTHELLARLMRHEHASLTLAQKCSGVAASSHLFSALFNFRHSPREPRSSQETASTWMGIKVLRVEERSNYPLALSVDDMGDGFSLSAQAGAWLDPMRVCEYMRTALEGLVDALENKPETAARAIDVMPEAERRQVVEEWNATDADYPAVRDWKEKCAHELFELQVEKSPEAIAVMDSEKSLSYGELNAQANRLAHYLRELGVTAEARVAICMERGLEMVVALLATLKAGGAYVPLDPTYPAGRLAYQLEDSAPLVLLIHDATRAALTGCAAGTRVINFDADIAEWACRPDHNPDRAGGPAARDLAYIIYTSGSTGLPKGVMVEHRGLVNLISWHCEAFHLTAGDSSSCLAGFGFDASVWEIWPPLCAGATLLLSPASAARDLEQLLAWWETQSIDISFLPTPVAELAFTQGVANRSLRMLLVGGDRLRRLAPPWMKFSLINNYGPTETTVVATSGRLSPSDQPLHIGRPISNTGIYILDANLQPAPIGVMGEIYIGGAGVARGYLNRPDLTNERFLPDPFSRKSNARLYKTGDLGRWLPDGRIEFLGRNDFQVKIRGNRIELGEIEAQISSHPAIQQCMVIARQDETTEKRVVAYLVCEGESAPSDGELRSYLKERIPEFMLPSAFVRLERMPLSPNGKVDRRSLPIPEAVISRDGSEYIAPRMPIEEMVVGIFEELLNLDRVGIRDNFFELGGHSLTAIRLLSRIGNTFGVEIGVRSVFEEPTAEGLARKIEEAMRVGEERQAPPLVRTSREERSPLSFAQRRLWFIDQLEPGNPIYNIPRAVRLKGSLNLDALERVINEIVRRHETLRTRIEVEAREPVQVIDKWEPRKLEVIDLTSLPSEEKEEQVGRIVREEVGTGFDLRRGPLLRVKVLKLEEEEHVVLYTMHHIVSDGWSMGVLIGEVEAVYQAYIAGNPSPLPELEIQYVDYAKWQRRYLKEGLLDEQLQYWKKQLGGELPSLKLLIDRPRPKERSRRAGRVYLALPPELTREITALCRREGVTLFMTLLAAFNALLSRYSGQEDIIVGTVVSNRNRIELERLIGFFVNTLPLRTDLSGDPTFRELLARVREVVLGAYAHQDAPFEMVVDEAQPKRNLHETPLFRAVLTLQNTPASTGRLPGLSAVPVATEGGVAKFDLILSFIETSQGLIGTLEYDTDLFDETGIKQASLHFRTLLENIVDNPDLPLSSLRLLSDLESKGRGPLDFPDLPLSQKDFENILLEIDSAPDIPAI